MTKNVLIAGASGFIGRNLVAAAPSSWDILATYNTSTDFPHFLETEGLRHVRAVRVNLTDETQAAREFGENRFDIIVNLSANVNLRRAEESPLEDLSSHVSPVINLMRHCSTELFVQFSSGAVYDGHMGEVGPGACPRPRFPYAIAKLAAEHYASSMFRQNRKGDLIIVRFFGAFGPYEAPHKLFTKLVQSFAFERRRSFSVVGDGENRIDPMFVDDATTGILAMLNRPPPGETIVDFAKGESMTVNELVSRAARTFGVEGIELTHSGRPPEYDTFHTNPSRFEQLFGFLPRIPLEEGLRRHAEWLKAARGTVSS